MQKSEYKSTSATVTVIDYETVASASIVKVEAPESVNPGSIINISLNESHVINAGAPISDTRMFI